MILNVAIVGEANFGVYLQHCAPFRHLPLNLVMFHYHLARENGANARNWCRATQHAKRWVRALISIFDHHRERRKELISLNNSNHCVAVIMALGLFALSADTSYVYVCVGWSVVVAPASDDACWKESARYCFQWSCSRARRWVDDGREVSSRLATSHFTNSMNCI